MTNPGTLDGVVPAIVDTHIHQWDPLRTPRPTRPLARLYKLAPRVMTAAMPRLLPQGLREGFRTPEILGRPYLPADYALDIAGVPGAVGVPVESVVHVQAGWDTKDPLGHADETRWVGALPWGSEGCPGLTAIVGYADPRHPRFADLLDAHVEASPRFRGIRCMGAWHTDKGVFRWADQEGLLRSRDFLTGFAALAARKLTFDAYVYSGQLADVGVLAAEFPDTTIVLDHFAPPVGWLGPMGQTLGRTQADRDESLAQWRDGIDALAAHPNVVAKLSGLALPVLGMPTARWDRTQAAESVAPLVDHTTAAFGPDRLMWGSNFPIDRAIVAYPDVIGALVDLLAPRGPDLLRKVFRDNGLRVYAGTSVGPN